MYRKTLIMAYLLGLLSLVVLAGTGFGPIVFGDRLQGYLLMVHVTFAPLFIICVVLIAVLAAGKFPFPGKLARSGFWLLLTLALPVILTMTLSMLPVFGAKGQEFLFEAHRWSALGFSLITIIELYMLIRMKVQKDSSVSTQGDN